MGVRYDFSDVERALGNVRKEGARILEDLGHEAVAYAKANGEYQDRTGRLRRSTDFANDESYLLVENDTPYASNVEHWGYDVLTGAREHLASKYGLKRKRE